jgi:1-deoxyxylulose-5-phosphate synthase
MQNRYNLVNHEEEREMIPFCIDRGIGVLPYSPLARGLLAGARDRSGVRSTTRAQADSAHRPADFDVPTRSARSRPSASCRRLGSPWPGCSAGRG